MMNFTCAIVFALALLLAQSSALPATRRSSSATETGSSRSRTSGSSSGSGDGCDRELTEEERTTLISNIRSTIDGLESTLNGVNVWVALVSSLFSLEDMIFISVLLQSATVGVYEYGDLGVNGGSSNCSALHSDYGYAIAKSVSFLQMFVRPVGDVLTNETVREVIERRTGFFDNYYTILGKLDTLTDDVYKLVRASLNHSCIYS